MILKFGENFHRKFCEFPGFLKFTVSEEPAAVRRVHFRYKRRTLVFSFLLDQPKLVAASNSINWFTKNIKERIMLIPFYLIFLFLILVPSSGKTTSKIKSIGSLPSKYLSKQSNSEQLFVNDAKRSIQSPHNPIVSAQDVTASSQASMRTVNLVNLLFYGTLGSVMPYLPLFYRILGVSGNYFCDAVCHHSFRQSL